MTEKKRIKYTEYIKYNTAFMKYGNACRIKKSLLKGIFICVCLIPLIPNVLILFVNKIIKNDLVIRYGG